MLITIFTIWLLYVAAMVSPGANVILVSQLAASGQPQSARFAGLGVAVGAGLWATCAVLGIHAVFVAFPGLRLTLQIAGGFYLLYVASRLWRSGDAAWNTQAPAVSRAAAFRLGLLTNVTNPKAALFFGSVFAASFPAYPSALLQMAVVAIVVASALCWYALLAYLFSRERIRAAYGRVGRVATRATSGVLAALGLSLLVASLRQASSRALLRPETWPFHAGSGRGELAGSP